jgi:hypothetical protein
LYYNWKLGLVAAAFVPLVLVSTYFQFKIIFGQAIVEKDQIEKSSKVFLIYSNLVFFLSFFFF